VTSHDRLKGAAAALAVQALLGWLLVAGLTASRRHTPESALSVFQVAPPPPPPPPEKKARAQPLRRRPPGEPSPPNLRSTATLVVAPPPIIPPPVPPPVVAALQPSTGAQSTSGAALVAGPGAGAGGVGDGHGGGGTLALPPRQIRGQISNADYPSQAAREGRSGGVDIRYLVGVDGRVGACRIVESSGSADLDDTACRLAQARFRFDPARDANGRKVAAWVDDGVEWVNRRPPPDAQP
jgi:protein TonB